MREAGQKPRSQREATHDMQPKGRVAAKRRIKLGVDVVKKLKAAKTEYIVWDEEVVRFGVRVLPTGSKVYVLRLRLHGQQRWVRIGAHGDPWTPETARVEAQRVLGLAAARVDVTVERERLKELPLVADFAVRYRRDHIVAHLKESSQEIYNFNLNNHVLPALGKRRIDAVTRADVEELHASLKAKPIAANRVVALVRHMMAKAEDWGMRPQNSNPARGIPAFKETPRRRYLTAEEWARLGAVLAASNAESPFVIAAFRLLALTGCRSSEIFRLQWSAVDLGRGVLELKDSKTGPKTIPLNEAALSILKALPKVAGNGYVVPGWKIGRPYMGEAKAWDRIRSDAGLGDVRIHDLRHSFASVAVSGGAGLPLVGAILGHSQPATTARYAHLAQEPTRALAQTVGTAIDGMMGNAPPAQPTTNEMVVEAADGTRTDAALWKDILPAAEMPSPDEVLRSQDRPNVIAFAPRRRRA